MWIFSLALVLGAVLSVAAWARAGAPGSAQGLTEEERARFVRAVEAFRSGAWEEAARGFSTEARQAGLLADYAQLLLAESLARSGDLAGARQAAGHLADRHSDSLLAPQAILLAATLASRQGDEAAAERFLRSFLADFPGRVEGPLVRYLLGLSLEAQGRGLEAARVLRELWLAAPASAYGEAAADRLRALASAGVTLPPPTPVERIERAERLQAGGHLALAREEAEALLAELPDPALTLRGLRLMRAGWRRGGRYDVAQRAADRALAAEAGERRARLLLELARLQWRAGMPGLALGSLDRLIREHPDASDVADALVVSGYLLEDAGRPGDAQARYRRAVTEFADREAAARALWRLGWLGYLGGDMAAAAAEFGRLAGLPVGAQYRLAASYWAGRAREAQGDRGEARRLFGVLLAEAPGSYYGILAGRRVQEDAASSGQPPAVLLPGDPFAPFAGDRGFARVEALRAVGLGEFALAELEEMQARSLSEPAKLYGLAAAFARDERYHLALRIFRRHFADLAASAAPTLPTLFWETFYPLAWGRDLVAAAERAGLDRFLVAAVVREESSFFPLARSPAGARGLMQLMPGTARSLALRRGLAFGNGDLLDEPATNLQLGASYLAGLLKEFPDPRLAAAAYNAGPARVREWWARRRSDDLELFVEQIPFEETRYFVKRVMVSWEAYRRIYGGDPRATGGGRP